MSVCLLIGVALLVIGERIPQASTGDPHRFRTGLFRAVGILGGLLLITGSVLVVAGERFVSECVDIRKVVTPAEGNNFAAWNFRAWNYGGRWTFVRGQTFSTFRGGTDTHHVRIDPKDIPKLRQTILEAWQREGGLTDNDPPRPNAEYPSWFPTIEKRFISLHHRSASFRGWVKLDPATGDVFFVTVD